MYDKTRNAKTDFKAEIFVIGVLLFPFFENTEKDFETLLCKSDHA